MPALLAAVTTVALAFARPSVTLPTVRHSLLAGSRGNIFAGPELDDELPRVRFARSDAPPAWTVPAGGAAEEDVAALTEPTRSSPVLSINQRLEARIDASVARLPRRPTKIGARAPEASSRRASCAERAPLPQHANMIVRACILCAPQRLPHRRVRFTASRIHAGRFERRAAVGCARGRRPLHRVRDRRVARDDDRGRVVHGESGTVRRLCRAGACEWLAERVD